jgi:hypothetical protein
VREEREREREEIEGERVREREYTFIALIDGLIQELAVPILYVCKKF